MAQDPGCGSCQTLDEACDIADELDRTRDALVDMTRERDDLQRELDNLRERVVTPRNCSTRNGVTHHKD